MLREQSHDYLNLLPVLHLLPLALPSTFISQPPQPLLRHKHTHIEPSPCRANSFQRVFTRNYKGKIQNIKERNENLQLAQYLPQEARFATWKVFTYCICLGFSQNLSLKAATVISPPACAFRSRCELNIWCIALTWGQPMMPLIHQTLTEKLAELSKSFAAGPPCRQQLEWHPMHEIKGDIGSWENHWSGSRKYVFQLKSLVWDLWWVSRYLTLCMPWVFLWVVLKVRQEDCLCWTNPLE